MVKARNCSTLRLKMNLKSPATRTATGRTTLQSTEDWEERFSVEFIWPLKRYTASFMSFPQWTVNLSHSSMFIISLNLSEVDEGNFSRLNQVHQNAFMDDDVIPSKTLSWRLFRSCNMGSAYYWLGTASTKQLIIDDFGPVRCTWSSMKHESAVEIWENESKMLVQIFDGRRVGWGVPLWVYPVFSTVFSIWI